MTPLARFHAETDNLIDSIYPPATHWNRAHPWKKALNEIRRVHRLNPDEWLGIRLHTTERKYDA